LEPQLEEAAACIVPVSSAVTAAVSSTLLLFRKTKTKIQLVILTLDRLDRFEIEITHHYGFTGWIP
jgi:hypothetical protein